MTDFLQIYADKLQEAETAVALIPSGSKIAMGLGVSSPPRLLQALAERALRGEVGDLDLYFLLSTANARPVLRTDIRHRIRPVSLFNGALERQMDDEAADRNLPPVDFIPCSFRQTPAILGRVVETLLVMVSPMDERGFFSLGTNADYSARLAGTAKQIIVEVNPSMPYAYGNNHIHVSQVAAIVENRSDLPELPAGVPRGEDIAIARHIGPLVDDGACLQLGIGALPDAVCSELARHRHLGIHTELMTPGLAGLMSKGIVDNSRKSIDHGKSVYTLTLGDRALYEFLDRNPQTEAHPVDYVNDPATIAKNSKVVSVNATFEIDLEGSCNSEFAAGRQYSGTGGQLDFVRGAFASTEGKSVIACHSTASKGRISRIVPRLNGPTTTPRTDIHYVATEFGIANLRGLTLFERAKAMIGLAHPDFREDLDRECHRRFGRSCL